MPTSTLVVLTGAPGTGKTAILDRLGSDIHRMPEPAREILADQRATAGTATPESDATRFVDLLLRRSIEHHRAAGRTEGPVIFDRGIPDCVAYAVVLGVDPAPSIEAAERYRYHSEVLIVEPWEDIYTVDDERTMSFADTLAFHEAIREAYEAAGYALVGPSRRDRRAGLLRPGSRHTSTGIGVTGPGLGPSSDARCWIHLSSRHVTVVSSTARGVETSGELTRGGRDGTARLGELLRPR